jgi:hypothetical protein
MKSTLRLLFFAALASFAFVTANRAADSPKETEQMRKERERRLADFAKQQEERKHAKHVEGALIFPAARTNTPSQSPKKE